MRKLLLLFLLLLLLLIAPVWAPVHLSYVYSDSMAPTINEGDGYILVPAGEVTPGEIITFYSPKRNAYITHRVVKETPAGFITKGDNNPVTDQATGLQPVDRSQIVGEVLTIGGTPIIIPHLGTLLGVFKSIQNIVIAGLLLAFTYSFLTANEGNQRPKRHVIKTRDIYRAVFIGVAIIGVSFI
ncbi:MAG: signal peptidase I, partial [Halobacteriaceae archaeon]